jgi:hypothetical protein
MPEAEFAFLGWPLCGESRRAFLLLQRHIPFHIYNCGSYGPNHSLKLTHKSWLLGHGWFPCAVKSQAYM